LRSPVRSWPTWVTWPERKPATVRTLGLEPELEPELEPQRATRLRPVWHQAPYATPAEPAPKLLKTTEQMPPTPPMLPRARWPASQRRHWRPKPPLLPLPVHL